MSVRGWIEYHSAPARRGIGVVVPPLRGRHVVICGYPRGGTSLLYNMLAAGVRGFEFEENEHAFGRYLARPGRALSKRPLDVLDLGDARKLNRYGKRVDAVVVVRDVRDVVTSRHPRVPGDYFIGYDASYFVSDPAGPKPTSPGVKAVFDAIERADEVRGVHVHRVRYEELVADPDAEQARLAAATGLSFSRPFSTFFEAGEKLPYRYAGEWAAQDAAMVRETSPVDQSRAGKWRKPEHRDRIFEQFTRHPDLFDMLRAHGYEADDAWFDDYRGAAGGAR